MIQFLLQISSTLKTPLKLSVLIEIYLKIFSKVHHDVDVVSIINVGDDENVFWLDATGLQKSVRANLKKMFRFVTINH